MAAHLIHMIDPSKAAFTLAKLKTPFNEAIDASYQSLKPVNSGLSKYGKALDKVGHLETSNLDLTLMIT